MTNERFLLLRIIVILYWCKRCCHSASRQAPQAAALDAKRKADCFADETLLLIYIIVEAHISTLAGRIFAIFLSFDQISLPFLFSIHISDRSAPKFHKGLKTAHF